MRQGKSDLQAVEDMGKVKRKMKVPGHAGVKEEAVSGNKTALVAKVKRHINQA